MAILFPSGEKLRISRNPLGTGGEGKVYRVSNNQMHGLVAKIYNKLPTEERQNKIKEMTAFKNSSLMESCAWPIDYLTDSNSGKICGFTMQEVKDSEPLHHHYSPSWRKQNLPEVTWEFLLSLSCNIAAAFNSIHSSGIIIGDINPNSVRVKKSGRVVLIDSDSFQLSRNGILYRCRVGVPSFTAPELLAQNISFDSVKRDINHDLFGLSLLIFHVLFMGRHPYAGVFRGHQEVAIEDHIREFRYAYANDNTQRKLLPPPLSVKPSELAGKKITEAFQNDFTQIGAINKRTSAAKWHEILAFQRSSLQRCRSDPQHVYDASLGRCVWCQLEKQGLVLFESVSSIPNNPTSNQRQVTPDLFVPTSKEQSEWQWFCSVKEARLVLPNKPGARVSSLYSLSGDERAAIVKRSVLRMALACLALAFLLNRGSESIAICVVLFCCGFLYNPSLIRQTQGSLRGLQQKALQNAAEAINEMSAIINQDMQSTHCKNVESAWRRLNEMNSKYAKEIENRCASVLHSRHESYMKSRLLLDANIPGIGASRKSTLIAFGIESAYDIQVWKIEQIRGFGPELTSSLLNWKKNIEAKYVAPSRNDIISKNLQDIIVAYRDKRRKAGRDFHDAIDDFRKGYAQISSRFNELKAVYTEQSLTSTRLKEDIRLLNKPASHFLKGMGSFLVF